MSSRIGKRLWSGSTARRIEIANPIETVRAIFESARTSDWLEVDQSTITSFGECTQDMDWLHTDPERAKSDSPFAQTVAHGYWTLSMLTYFSRQMTGDAYPTGALYGLNYGFDRVRFMAPVPVGSRIRCRGKLLDITNRGDEKYLVKSEYQIEVEGQQKPAMIAEWLCLFGFPTTDA